MKHEVGRSGQEWSEVRRNENVVLFIFSFQSEYLAVRVRQALARHEVGAPAFDHAVSLVLEHLALHCVVAGLELVGHLGFRNVSVLSDPA